MKAISKWVAILFCAFAGVVQAGEWADKRTSKITLGPAYEYDRNAADHELQLKEEVEDAEYVAIPVYGATSASEINPVVVHHNSTAADIAAIEIRTDAQMFSAIVQPLLKYKSQWNSSSGYYYIYTSNAVGCWPTSLWPDNKAVSGRFWIIITPNSGNWYGMRDFRVGLFGTDEVTDRIYLANDSTFGPAACDKACLDTKRVTYGGKSAPRMNYGTSFASGGIGTKGDCLGGTFFRMENVKPASFTATVSEPGMFVLSGNDHEISYDSSTQTYTCILRNCKSQMTVSGDAITADSEECHEEYQSIIDEVNIDEVYTNRYWRHGGGAYVRRVAVGKAGTCTFASKSHGSITANRVHFFPANRRSVAVDAICMTARQFYMCSHDIAYGYVLGSGVFVAGETVSFTAVPAPDNQFDHWEVAFADNHAALNAALAGKSMTSPTLSFTVTDAMCGEMTEEKQIVLRAVWKEKRIPEIIPLPIGAATLSGNKEIFEGENVTVTLKPVKNCSFVRWIDDADCGTSRTFSYDASGSDEPMRAIFSGTPVNPVPHIEVENLEDSYAVGEEIDPISIGVESGTGYSVKVSGLPAGLSYANGRISGTPTKTGSFTVTATATKSGESTLTYQFTINVTVKFYYELNDDGDDTITLTYIDTESSVSGELIIPSEYDGYTVTRIGSYMHCTRSGGVHPITSVRIPSSVVALDEDAFCDISTLRTVIFSEGLEEIGLDSFLHCGITAVDLPASLQSYPTFAFGYNPIERISVAADSPYYFATNNLLISKADKKVVLCIHNAGNVIIPEGAEAIGNNAFEGDVVKSFTFPSTLKYIEPQAFNGNDASFPSSVDLSACVNLTKVDSAAFVSWANLTTVKFPTSLTQLGAWAFARCTALKTVYFNGQVPEIVHNETLDAHIKNPDFLEEPYRDAIYVNCGDKQVNPSLMTGVTTYVQPGQGWDDIVADGIWQNCKVAFAPGAVAYGYNFNEDDEGITLCWINSGMPSGALVIPSTYDGYTVTGIGENLFAGNTKITSVVIPATVKTIGKDAFDSCLKLKDLTLGDGVETIGSFAFGACAIETVSLPASVTNLIGSVFAQNPKKKFIVDSANPRYYVSDDGKLLLDRIDETFVGCIANPGTVSIPEGIVTIGSGALEDVSWSKISFPSTLQNLMSGAIHVSDSKITELDFSETSLRRVGPAAFWGTSKVKKIVFPATLSELCDFAFAGCYSLEVVQFNGGQPEVLDESDDEVANVIANQIYGYGGSIPAGDRLFMSVAYKQTSYIDYQLVSVDLLKSVTTYVQPGQGWDDIVVSGTWQGRPIKIKKSGVSEYGPYVPGEKVSEIVEELVGYTAKGLPAGLKLNSKTGEISGTPTKPTGDAGAIVTFTKKGEETLTAQFIVGPLPKLTIETVGSGTVKGAGSYAANAKVSLKATAGKGQVFAGWYLADGGAQGLTALPGTVDYRTANYSYVMPAEDVTLYAKFVPASEDTELAMENLEAEYEINSAIEMQFSVRSYSLPTVKASGLPTGLKFDAKTLVLSGTPTKPGKYTVTFTITNLSNKKGVVETTVITVPNIVSEKIDCLDSSASAYNYMQGVSIGEGIEPEVEDGYTLSVSGLPKGLSCDKKTGKITGTPTAAPGAYTVVFTAKKKGAATETATITINVEPAPISAGTVFNGFVGRDEESSFANIGTFKLALAASGALSAVIETANGKSTLAANGGSDVSGDIFKADLSDKSGNKAAIEIDIATALDSWQLLGSFYEKKSGTTYAVTAQVNVFGQSWYFKATKVEDENNSWTLAYAEDSTLADFTVTMKADGSATAKGKIGSYSINATSFLATDGLKDGAFMADFVQFVNISGKKYPLSIRTNLWLDGSDIHESGAGAVRVEK